MSDGYANSKTTFIIVIFRSTEYLHHRPKLVSIFHPIRPKPALLQLYIGRHFVLQRNRLPRAECHVGARGWQFVQWEARFVGRYGVVT